MLVLAAACAFAVDTADWMRGVRDDAPLRRIAIPGAHDAGTAGMPWYSRTQDADTATLLADGVRYLALVNLERRSTSLVHLGFDGGVVPTQRSWYQTYEPRKPAADPVLAKRSGKEGASKLSVYLSAGQLALFRLGR